MGLGLCVEDAPGSAAWPRPPHWSQREEKWRAERVPGCSAQEGGQQVQPRGRRGDRAWPDAPVEARPPAQTVRASADGPQPTARGRDCKVSDVWGRPTFSRLTSFAAGQRFCVHHEVHGRAGGHPWGLRRGLSFLYERKTRAAGR